MSPFAGDGVGADARLPRDRHPATNTSTENDAEHHTGIRTGAVDGFRYGKAVCIVGDSHRPAEEGFQITIQRTAVQPRGVGVLDQPRRRRDGPGNANTDAASASNLLLDRTDQRRDHLQRRGIVAAWCRHAQTELFRTASRESDSFDFGPADVDSDPHRPIICAPLTRAASLRSAPSSCHQEHRVNEWTASSPWPSTVPHVNRRSSNYRSRDGRALPEPDWLPRRQESSKSFVQSAGF